MANGEQHPDSAILFRNRDKKEGKHPDYKGDITILCGHCGTQDTRPLVAWIRDGRNGSKFMTLSFRPREASRAGASAAQLVDSGDDIPF